MYPEQYIKKESRSGSLFCFTSYLFIIHHTMDRTIFFLSSCQKSLQRSKSTLQIIQSSNGKELLIRSPYSSGLTIVKKKIMSQRDMETLKKWHKMAARAESLGKFEQAIEELATGKDTK